MARDALPAFVGHSIHGQTQATLMKLHQQSLERTLNPTITIVDNDSAAAKQQEQQQQRTHNKKKKKYYPWLQRDSQNQRNKIGQEGSRRRNRHDNDKFVHHPFAVLYQIDLPFPGHGHDAPSFHWKYDAMIESMINNNPPSSRRSKPESASQAKEDASSSPATPLIGHHLLTRAQRKDIKKVHVPQGIVMQYEGELVSFLNQLTLSDDDHDEESEEDSQDSASDCFTPESEEFTEDSKWVLVQSSVEAQAPQEEVVQKKQQQEQLSPKLQQNEERPQLYLQWDIQDQFLRFVAHALVSFYGLVSFSKTALDGKRIVYICHPTHLDSIGELTTPVATSVAAPTPAPSETAAAAPIRPKSPKRQSTIEHVQELPLHELDQLWTKVEPTKVSNCLRPDMTFFEYLYPSMRPMF